MIADRWHVGFVDIGGGRGLLGQVEGRSADTVADWLRTRTAGRRKQVRDRHVHRVPMRRTHRPTPGDHRGGTLQTASGTYVTSTRNRENLSKPRFARMWNTLIDLGDPGYDILAAHITRRNSETRSPAPTPARTATASPNTCSPSTTGAPAPTNPELDRLARTIEQWWPHIEAFIHTRITNATSEGINRVVKPAARNALGFRNPDNQRLRLRCATTRKARGHLKPGRLRRP
ncbi:MAG TPA: transposase [Micromonosporaceae bacterium]